MNVYEGTTAARRRRFRSRAAGRLGWMRLLRPELAALVVLAAMLNMWALGRNGWANSYYSAAVRSMSSSWHNFLYASFDPSGVMTVDKPPLALWVQALSVRVFGYHPVSILAPQGLMGVASVVLVYDLTRRRFGRVAGAVAGLALATTPIAVATSRHNNPDALLVLCLTASLWFVVRGLEDGRTRWLVLAGVSIGLGFETKMGAALLVAPALFAAWLWMARHGRIAALRQAGAAAAALVAVACAWPLLVTLTPPGSRPWIAGTSDNSIWSLIWGYNGIGRLDGQAGGPQAFGGGGPGGGAGGGGPFGGSSGPFRLLNTALGGQAGWLLGFALVGGVAILLTSRLRRSDVRSGWLIATGGAFATIAVAFSAASGIFHPYYTSELAPFTAALAGAGAAQLLGARRSSRVLGALAIAAGVAVEIAVHDHYPGQMSWLPLVLILACAPVAIALLVFSRSRVRAVALAVAIGVLMIAPATWAIDTLGHTTSGTFPAGGPAMAGQGVFGPVGGPGRPPFSAGGGGFVPPGGRGLRPAGGPPPDFAAAGAPRGGLPGGGPFGLRGPGGRAFGAGGPAFGETASPIAVLRYIHQHGGGTLALSSQSGASQAIISFGAKVAGIGGFSGRESSVTTKWLAGEVRSGQIRWVFIDGGGTRGGPGRDARAGPSAALAAVRQICTRTPYGSSAGAATGTISIGLYDCAGHANALAAARSSSTSVAAG